MIEYWGRENGDFCCGFRNNGMATLYDIFCSAEHIHDLTGVFVIKHILDAVVLQNIVYELMVDHFLSDVPLVAAK